MWKWMLIHQQKYRKDVKDYSKLSRPDSNSRSEVDWRLDIREWFRSVMLFTQIETQ